MELLEAITFPDRQIVSVAAEILWFQRAQRGGTFIRTN